MIQWFPGHMTKALRQMQDEIKNIDLVLYVLDSRVPNACFNPKFAQMIGDKPIIYILNKFDLSDGEKLKGFKQKLTSNTSACLQLDSTQSGASKKISKLALELCAPKIERRKQKGLGTIIRCMVIGVPNSGKSTLVNNLCSQSRAITGNKPGVTKGKQWVRVSDCLEVLDTPGTLWPSFENQEIANQLAFVGSISDNVVDLGELAIELLKTLCLHYPGVVEKRYAIADSCQKEFVEVLEDIARARHFVLRGGEIDYDRTCAAVVDDFRKGRFGKITLL